MLFNTRFQISIIRILLWIRNKSHRIKTESYVIPYKTVFQWQLSCRVLEALTQFLKQFYSWKVQLLQLQKCNSYNSILCVKYDQCWHLSLGFSKNMYLKCFWASQMKNVAKIEILITRLIFKQQNQYFFLRFSPLWYFSYISVTFFNRKWRIWCGMPEESWHECCARWCLCTGSEGCWLHL